MPKRKESNQLLICGWFFLFLCRLKILYAALLQKDKGCRNTYCMMFIRFLFCQLFLLIFIQPLWAQEELIRQNRLVVKPDQQSKSSQTKENTDSRLSQDTTFQPSRSLTVVSEDTNALRYEEVHLVQVSEYLKIDCVWVKAAEYYAIWSSEYINPYNIKPGDLKDTIPIRLYDRLRNQLWAPPLEVYRKTSGFGPRWGQFHHGIDLGLSMGMPVFAAFDGIVRLARYDRYGYGYHVVLRHYNGLETLYAHLSKIECQVGQEVKAGDIIGLGGSTGRSTGPHLHFEVRYAGNTFNPEEIFDFYSPPEESLKTELFYLLPHHFRHLGVRTTQQVWHIVRSGDTLSSIARRYGVSLTYLMRINGLSSRSILRVGQRIRIR